MTPREIANKYVYGTHDALTDSQEVEDMIVDIRAYRNDCIKAMFKKDKTLIEEMKGYSFPLRQDVVPVANTTEIPKHRLIEFDKDNKDIDK